jgi:hypothetical protein
MVLTVLLSFLASISVLTFSSSSKTVFLGAVYAAPLFPLEGAMVTASGPEGYGFAWTDSSGQYSITEGLMTGNYTVTASAEGYLDAEIEDVAVTEGLETSNVNFLLDVSGGISGKITEAGTGSPLQSVLVTAESSVGGGIYESAFTDVNGDYLINTNLVTGTYNVTASYATGHITKDISGIAVTTGIETKNVDLDLEKSGILSGTVTDSVSSAPLEDILIAVSDAGGAFGGYAITNSSGEYRVDTNLGTGTYNVSAFFPEGYISKEISGIDVTAGLETTADLALDPSGIISGRVTAASSGQPVAEASVVAFSEDFTYFGSAETNETGYYMISSGLGTETYTLYASFGMAFNTTMGVEVVAGSETSNVDMQLDITITPSGTITGRVTNTTGSPIEGAFVFAEGPAGSGDAQTDSNGDYSISTGLGTGTYTVNASATGYSMVSATDVSVTVDQVTPNVDFELPTAPSGIISGKVEAEFIPIPEFSHTLFVFLFAASIASVAFAKLRATRRKALSTLERTPAF